MVREHPPTRSELEHSLLYSEQLDIRLADADDTELFKWFVASVLFGRRISQTIAEHTYRTFVQHGLVTPRSILDAGWGSLVDPVMREGGYVRYDGQTSTQILRNCQTLLDRFDGSLNRLHDIATDPDDLERRVRAFHRVGPVTANIFLRELRPIWTKADPDVLPRVREAAATLHVDLDDYDRKTLAFARVEAGLIRWLAGHRASMPAPG
jgi:hypothetical protein